MTNIPTQTAARPTGTPPPAGPGCTPHPSRWSDAAVRHAVGAYFGVRGGLVYPHGDLLARMRRALDAADARCQTETQERARVTRPPLHAVWVLDADGAPLHVMGQSTSDPQELADKVTRAAACVEQGIGAQVVVWQVGAGAPDERRHADALVAALTRAELADPGDDAEDAEAVPA